MADKNGSGSKPDVEKLRAEIRQTRAELGETVQALAARADVKARARAEVEQAKQRVRAQAAEATGRFREAAHAATDKLRHPTGRGSAEPGTSDTLGGVGAGLGEQVRRAPIPLTAVLIAAAAVIGVILVVRGRRR